VNSASFGDSTDPFVASVAPGTIVSIFGSHLADGTATAADTPLPSNLLGTSVTFNGVPAPLFFVSPEQINAQVPFEVPVGEGTVAVQVQKGPLTSNYQSVPYAESSPGVFTHNQGGVGSAVVLHAESFLPVSILDPARPNDYLAIFATGLGAVQPSIESGSAAPSVEPLARTVGTPLVTIDGIPAEVIYSGLTPGMVGLYQVNIQVPAGIQSGMQTVEINHQGVTSNLSTVPVESLLPLGSQSLLR
jgi:uncharacterized protein (TIGR03437 family)